MKINKSVKAVAFIGSLLIGIASGFLLNQPSAAGNAVPSAFEIEALIHNPGQTLRETRSPSAGVHGIVIAQAQPAGKKGKKLSQDILMPGIELYLHNMATNQDTSRQVSDMMGRFRFPAVANGTYELRWPAQKGWAAGTFPEPVIIRGTVFYAEPVSLQPEPGKGVVIGNLNLADGTTPWFYSEAHGVVKSPTVTMLDSATNGVLSAPVLANFAGQFVIAGIDRRAKPKLAVTIEGLRSEQALSAKILSAGGTSAPVSLTLKNYRPRILDITATANGQRVRAAQPGSTVQVYAKVEDRDGNPLEFAWSTDNGTVTGKGATVQWQLPQQPGTYTITLLVSDGMGGADTKQLVLNIGSKTAVFSGVVVGPDGAPISYAYVSVNGVETKSEKDGRFEVKLDVNGRYVLNIHKPGFALLSRLFDRPVNRRWQLVPAQVERVEGNKDINIVDRRADIKKKKLGSSVQLSAGSLVDPSGNKASGSLTAEIATLDIANNEMPGDFLASENGTDVGLVSYGAFWVEFTDAAGQKLQLAPGASARVTISVPDSMRKKAPMKMIVWSYHEGDGRWKQSGTATYNSKQRAYIGDVTHLSTINMDQSGPVSCIRVHTDIGLPAELTLRVSDVPGGAVDFAQVKSMVLDGEEFTSDGPLNAVLRLPANNLVQFEVLNDTGVLVSASGNPMVVVEDGDSRSTIGTPLANNQVMSGPADSNLWPPYPYAPCTKDVTIKLFPRWGSYPQSSFLTFRAPLPGEGGTASAATANAYYNAVDPGLLRRKLSDWFGQNGFDPNGNPPVGSNPAEYARTSYLNNNDLGSGRDMNFHIDPVAGTLSAYVTNYSRGVAFDQRSAFADDAAARANPGATVCMEFSAVEGDTSTIPPRKIVKFFVYFDAAGDGDAEIQPAANLDGFGARFVPGLCINCHGFGPAGGYFDPDPATIDDVNIGANFRELDLATYHFPGNRVLPSAAEEAAFRAQNLMIRDIALAVPATATQVPVTRGPIVDLITNWYPGTTQDNSFTPANWGGVGSASRGLYHDVIKVSCRTCHIAFDAANNSNGNDWNRYDQMTSAGRRSLIRGFAVGPNWTTGSSRLMPHALVTYRNFWLQTTVAPNPQGSRVQRLWEYSDGATWPAFNAPVPP